MALLWMVVPPVFNWVIGDATVSGNSKSACTGDGACWTFIKLRLHTFFWGHYPDAELWRVALAAVLLVVFSVPVMRDHVRHRGLFVLLLLTVFPLLAGILLVGGVPGLPYVDTSQWGGLMLDVIISFVTVAGALPLGVLLALGRRSQLAVIKYLSIGFIELWRGVPLLTVLFMSAVMVPLFLPHGVSVDRLIRAMVAFTLFNAAYMAETVRGGLQGVPVGQEEAAYSLGLRWWQVQAFVTLPQALRIVVPGIVNNIVDLFKDTSLVTIIGLVDLLGAVDQSLKDPGLARPRQGGLRLHRGPVLRLLLCHVELWPPLRAAPQPARRAYYAHAGRLQEEGDAPGVPQGRGIRHGGLPRPQAEGLGILLARYLRVPGPEGLRLPLRPLAQSWAAGAMPRGRALTVGLESAYGTFRKSHLLTSESHSWLQNGLQQTAIWRVYEGRPPRFAFSPTRRWFDEVGMHRRGKCLSCKKLEALLHQSSI